MLYNKALDRNVLVAVPVATEQIFLKRPLISYFHLACDFLKDNKSELIMNVFNKFYIWK